MNTEQMKAEYEANPEKWVLYITVLFEPNKWRKLLMTPQWNETADSYKLILKEHEHIADAVIADSDVKLELFKHKSKLTSRWDNFNANFFDVYSPLTDYRLAPTKPKQWNGYYIEASQEAYDKLIELGYKTKTGYVYELLGEKLFAIYDGVIRSVSEHFQFTNMTYKPFYLVDGEFTETKPTVQGEEDGLTNKVIDNRHKNDTGNRSVSELSDSKYDTNNTRINTKETISIIDSSGKEYSFDKPEFECELLAIDNDLQIVGLTYPNGAKTLTYFNIQGEAFEIDEELLRWHNKDLIPIKQGEEDGDATTNSIDNDILEVRQITDKIKCGKCFNPQFLCDCSKASTQETISITDENNKEYKFEKPEFECELLKVVEVDLTEFIVGYIIYDKMPYSTLWDLESGDRFNGLQTSQNYLHGLHDLTPIKQACFIKTVQYYNDNSDEMFIVEQDFVDEEEFKEAIKNTIKVML